MNYNNVRVKKTKDNLKLSLLKLCSQKQLTEITVKELCDFAQVQRGTFYRHYQNITELHEEILHEDIGQIIDFFSSLTPSSLNISDIKKTLSFIKEKNTFLFITYMKPAEFDSFNNSFKDSIIKNMSKTLDMDLTNSESFNTICFMYAGVYEYINQWVQTNYATSVDAVAQHIYTLLKAISETIFEE